MKADFIPQLDDEDDTSYFDTRSERYDHADTDTETRSSAADSLEDTLLFRSFSSCSPRYRKVHNKSRDLFRNSISQCESSDTSDLTFSLVRACFGDNNTEPTPMKVFQGIKIIMLTKIVNLGALLCDGESSSRILESTK